MAKAYINAYQEDDQLVLLHRNPAGELRATRRPCEYVSYHLRSQVEKYRHHLQPSSLINSSRDEGEWVRVAWSDRDTRREQCGQAAEAISMSSALSPSQPSLSGG